MPSTEELLALLSGPDFGATQHELADALWLAVQMAADRASQKPPHPADDPAAVESLRGDAAETPGTDELLVSTGTTGDNPAFGNGEPLWHQNPAPGAGELTGHGALPLRLPDPREIRRPLDLQRALRSLKQTVPAGPATLLDEEATVERSAEAMARTVLPVWTQSSERWLSLALVIDTSPSMLLWENLTAELLAMLAQLGAFRTIRCWQLRFDDGRVGICAPGAPGAPRSPLELVDPTGRQAILVLTDCVGDVWKSGAAMRAVRMWARTGPLAILQPLSQELWERSASAVWPVWLRSRFRGAPNHRLVAEAGAMRPGGGRSPGIPVPVLEIKPDWLASWARLISSTDRTMILAADTDAPAQVLPEPLAEPADPAGIVECFMAGASAEAFKLAGLLAAAPKCLPIPLMRLIQHTMLDDPQPMQLAEAYLGGLLCRAAESRVAEGGRSARFEFLPGVRDLLLTTIRRSEAIRVNEIVAESEFAEPWFPVAESPRGYEVLVGAAAGPDGTQLTTADERYGRIDAKVLDRIGGRYAEIARSREATAAAAAQARSAEPGSAAGSLSASRVRERVARTLRPQPTGGRGAGPAAAPGTSARPVSLAYFLRPEAEVVRFRAGRELLDLRDWCLTGPAVSARLVAGPGGSGKTRLAVELARQLLAGGWQVIWAAPGLDPVAESAASGTGGSVLTIVDYLETRDVLAVLRQVRSRRAAGSRDRVLLLARGSATEWRYLLAAADSAAAELVRELAVPIAPGPLPTGSAGLADAFEGAVADFAAALGVRKPKVPPPPGHVDTILSLHVEALLAVLHSGSMPDEPAAERAQGDVLAQLLAHEARYWEHTARARGLDLGSGLLRSAVAAASLIGADGEADAATVVSCLPTAGQGALPRPAAEIARWLHELYPADHDDLAQPHEWLSPLRPDLLADHLIVAELSADPDLLARLFGDVPERRVAWALVRLAHACERHQAAENILRAAFAAIPDRIAVPAVTVTAQVDPLLARLLAESLTGQDVATLTLERVVAAIPRAAGGKVASLAVDVLHRLTRDPDADLARQAGWLVDLSWRLTKLGQAQEAIIAGDQALIAYRELGLTCPDESRPAVIAALTRTIGQLSAAGQRELAADLQFELELIRLNGGRDDLIPVSARASLLRAAAGLPDRAWLGITLLGPPTCGKTTFLASLNVALARAGGGWKLAGANPAATERLVALTKDLVNGRFPEPGAAPEHYQWLLLGRVRRPARRRWPGTRPDREEAVSIGLDLADAPGEVAGVELGHSMRAQLLDDLVRSRGILFFFDPISEFERGDAFDYVFGILTDLTARMIHLPSYTGHLPHYVAVCVSKFDATRVLRTAEHLRLLTANPDDHYQFPRVDDEDARTLLAELGKVSHSGNADLAFRILERYFRPDRIKYFITSSIGFHVNKETGHFDNADHLNTEPDPGDPRKLQLRGALHPINVAEPILWLADRLASDAAE